MITNMLDLDTKKEASLTCKYWDSVIFSRHQLKNIALVVQERTLQMKPHTWSSREYKVVRITSFITASNENDRILWLQPKAMFVTKLVIELSHMTTSISATLSQFPFLQHLIIIVYYPKLFFNQRYICLKSLKYLSLETHIGVSSDFMKDFERLIRYSPNIEEIAINFQLVCFKSANIMKKILTAFKFCGDKLKRLQLYNSYPHGYEYIDDFVFGNIQELELGFDEIDENIMDKVLSQFKRRQQQIKLILHFDDDIITCDQNLRQLFESCSFVDDFHITSVVENPDDKNPYVIPNLKVSLKSIYAVSLSKIQF
jgi:hypothetical protein